jgi:hypothetical protein
MLDTSRNFFVLEVAFLYKHHLGLDTTATSGGWWETFLRVVLPRCTGEEVSETHIHRLSRVASKIP